MDPVVLDSLFERSAPQVLGWLLTYGVHSTLFAGAAWAVARRRFGLSAAACDTMWKTALVAGIATATLQTAVTGPILSPALSFESAPRVEPHAPAHCAPQPEATSASVTTPPPATGSPTFAQYAVAVQKPPAAPPAMQGPLVRRVPRYTAVVQDRPARADRFGGAGSITATPSAAGAGVDLSWPAVLVGLWGAGALFGAARIGAAALRLRGMLGERRTITRGRPYVLAHDVAERLGYTGPLTLTVSESLPGPVAVGLDEVCLPERAVRALPEDELRAVLTHEIAHLQRRDPLWNFAARTIEAVFFFQPLNRWLRLQLQEQAEFACDDRAAEFGGGGLIVARSLARIAQWVQSARSTPALASAMARRSSPLVARVERLLDRNTAEPGARRWHLAVPAAVAVAVLVSAPAVMPLALHAEDTSTTASGGKKAVVSEDITAPAPPDAPDAPGADVVVVRDGKATRYALPGRAGQRGAYAFSTSFPARKSRIGVFTAPLGELAADQLGLAEGKGVAITGIVEGSAAEKAGLKRNDVVVAMDGKEPVTVEEFTQALASKEPGSEVALTVLRKGQRVELRATTEAPPKGEDAEFFAAPSAPGAAWFGPGAFAGIDEEAQAEAEAAIAEAMAALQEAQANSAGITAEAKAELERALAESARGMAQAQRELAQLDARRAGALAPLGKLPSINVRGGNVAFAYGIAGGGDDNDQLIESWSNQAAKRFLDLLEANNPELAKAHQEEITAAVISAFDDTTPSSISMSVSEEVVNGESKREVKGSLSVNRKLLEAAMISELQDTEAAAKDADRDTLIQIAETVAGELSKYESEWTGEE